MKYLFSFLFLLFLLLNLIHCDHNYDIVIKGNISNLPDGTINILDETRKILQTKKTKNGSFEFRLSSKNYDEPILIEITHIDMNNNSRFFHFNTFVSDSRGKMLSQYLMLENGISIYGEIEDFKPVSAVFPKNLKFVYPKNPVHIGRQTQVMYSDSLNFRTITKISKIKELITQHSYSYYYLYELKKRVSFFSNEQFLSLLKCFDKDVQESKTGRELREYIENRNNKKLDFTTLLIDRNAKEQVVLQKNAKINMIILWASWCGPCRKEIPQLKKVYEQFSNNAEFNMVSISMDNNKENWYKALDKEQMAWKQLIITPETVIYSKELFSFDGSIPTTLFVDENGQIIKKLVGYDDKSLKESIALIEQSTITKKKNEP